MKSYIVYLTGNKHFWYRRGHNRPEVRIYKFKDDNDPKMKQVLEPYSRVNQQECIFIPFGIYETLKKLDLWNIQENVFNGPIGG